MEMNNTLKAYSLVRIIARNKDSGRRMISNPQPRIRIIGFPLLPEFVVRVLSAGKLDSGDGVDWERLGAGVTEGVLVI